MTERLTWQEIQTQYPDQWVVVTQEALEDVSNLADYILDTFKNRLLRGI